MNSPGAETYDVVIVGAGIVGLSQAWAASEQGKRVLVLEEHPKSLGASVRNFGMFWPIGHPPGIKHEYALRSRDWWLKLKSETGIYARECGSLFVAIDETENQILQEFHALRDEYDVSYLNRSETLERSPLVRPDTVKGSLYSPTEVNIDPIQAMASLGQWLQDKRGVTVRYSSPVHEVGDEYVTYGDKQKAYAENILVCQGHVSRHLFPEATSQYEVIPCKLHMMKTKDIGSTMGPMLASGLTLRHYPTFQSCPSLAAYKNHLEQESPELDRYGIHVMISQSSSGELVLGDSHQYGDDIAFYQDERIDSLLLEELQKRFLIEQQPISKRWQGHYLKRMDASFFIHDVSPHIRIINGLGGNGMTLSFAMAERMWQKWDDPQILSGLNTPVTS